MKPTRDQVIELARQSGVVIVGDYIVNNTATKEVITLAELAFAAGQASVAQDAERYKKLRRWMTSNVKEGWDEVCRIAGVGCYLSYADFDDYLDSLPVCNVGLSYSKEDTPEVKR